VGHVDSVDAPGAAGARREGGHDRRARPCPFRRQQKEKLGDDDADVGMTQGRSHLAAGGAVGSRRG
jgi:hypothetical protein